MRGLHCNVVSHAVTASAPQQRCDLQRAPSLNFLLVDITFQSIETNKYLRMVDEHDQQDGGEQERVRVRRNIGVGEDGSAAGDQSQQPDPRMRQNNADHDYHRSLKYRIQIFLVVTLSICAVGLFGIERYLTYSLNNRRLSKATEAAQKLRSKQSDTNNGENYVNNKSTSSSAAQPKTTIAKSALPDSPEMHIHRVTRTARFESRTLYWNRAMALLNLADWDPTLSNDGDRVLQPDDASVDAIQATSTGLWSSDAEGTRVGLKALQMAAEEGHPLAQKYLGVALASGFWPTMHQPTLEDSIMKSSDKDGAPLEKLVVQQDMVEPTSHQQQKAMLMWQMAAIGGDAEAAMVVLNRLENLHHQEEKLECEDKLPYYRAIADYIVDALDANPHSRGKVAPAMDRHVLHQLHLFGGTQSKLDTHNQPDESEQALQFYHVRAMDQAANEAATSSSSASGSAGSDSGTSSGASSGSSAPSKSQTTGSAAAAFTLAHLYHYGLRGVPQNLTQALYYYEFAARQGHWEAAGHAGDFYFWGIGVDKDAYQARKLWRQGMPFGVDGCRKRLNQKLHNPKQASNAGLCDAGCLNGMGLLLLMGLPIMVQVDVDMAEKHFQLAREQGNKDASYHLAMMAMGWKTHFVSLEGLDHLQDGGQTRLDKEHHFPTTKKGLPLFHPSHQEWTNIHSYLSSAAQSGHIQAKHMLGDMYSKGATAINRGNNVVVVPKDCDKATKTYKWIIEHASPHRSQRLRRAYKQYMAGNTAGSLRNYMMAAEAGSDLAQVNAAFLLEQGECLGLSRVDCAKASVRLWKAAAARGNAEASLRVGDFYYYGRFRAGAHEGVVGPFGFVQCVLYPEKFAIKLWAWLEKAARGAVRASSSQQDSGEDSAASGEKQPACPPGEAEDQSCPARFDADEKSSSSPTDQDAYNDEHSVDGDLEMSATYYRMAAERASSPRANFNLGFLYEWGLGLKQDFPLAKRHYDLAMDHGSSESELPISIALICLSLHETLVKFWMSWRDWLEDASQSGSERRIASDSYGDSSFAAAERHRRPGGTDGGSRRNSDRNERTKIDVVVSHLLSWESLLVLVLSILLWVLMQLKQRRRTRR